VLVAALPPDVLLAARDKVFVHDRDRFVSEVAPFLPAELAASFAERWESIQLETADLLERRHRKTHR
jgi:hypothetical protein